uniref:Plant thionin family protein n=1 Tax=Zea mays TaxID=4577 RepID=B6TP27_MAIZE|nr:hypothetical protein [Zea mays]
MAQNKHIIVVVALLFLVVATSSSVWVAEGADDLKVACVKECTQNFNTPEGKKICETMCANPKGRPIDRVRAD